MRFLPRLLSVDLLVFYLLLATAAAGAVVARSALEADGLGTLLGGLLGPLLAILVVAGLWTLRTWLDNARFARTSGGR